MDINEKLSRHNKHCEGTKNEYKKLEKLLEKFSLNTTYPIQFHCLTMAISVWETTYCMLHLRKLESDNQMFPMLRQVMELSCYLAFIAKDPHQNYERIAQKDFKARLSYLGRKNSPNDDSSMIDDRIKLLDIESDLNSKHGRVLRFDEILKEVAPAEFYDTYRFLSAYTHSNLVSLERRFQKNNSRVEY